MSTNVSVHVCVFVFVFVFVCVCVCVCVCYNHETIFNIQFMSLLLNFSILASCRSCILTHT